MHLRVFVLHNFTCSIAYVRGDLVDMDLPYPRKRIHGLN